ncbi:uncharacterized protein LOC114132035 [Aphis gossypii]|uniref:C2H2-type domain-containing protein n=1 Tax=Aphis gossypii TaxID=80765 RepID=A0A9P0NB88_APHGO|nr:uncharacterized protein LOC114132035 [Aphis gossypii]XP_027853209.1 uncharacterized protein LOC114132035 [Aphis gossypii]XP_027853210.1 uncharacterized protein LOC114132035 [Aphis gossypii]CAH1714639.1 unnamed protein product [Aphis gossypii]
MSKNPFVNCKSRKRRKNRGPIPRPQEKLYCPRTMVRYDNSQCGYSPVWACKMCLCCLLSEKAVKEHLIKCNASSKKDGPSPTQSKKKDNENEDVHYTCDTCHKVFSRRVTLKKHLEVHESVSSGLESEQSDNEIAEVVNDVEITEADLISDNESEGSNASDLANNLI